MPVGGTFRAVLRDRLETISSVFLLRSSLRLHRPSSANRTARQRVDWAVCLAIILVATTGKLGGTVLAARWPGLSWRASVALGSLMNTRGLMELIALNVGYDLGILTPESSP